MLAQCLEELNRGEAPPHDVALIGPRGNGKTVLLHWFEQRCRDREARVDVVVLTPADLPGRGALLDLLLPESAMAKRLPRKIEVAALGALEWPPPSAGPRNLREELTARCRRKPLAVLVDEAHTLGIEVGRLLLNTSQQVRAGAPFLLALAGTPGLAAHLGAMNASFWNRLGKGRLGVGLLSADAARDALRKPLAAHGVSIAAAALDAVVEESQRYPYFVQLWGEALWDRRLATGATRLTASDVESARPEVAARVADYYEDRYLELDRSGWLTVAEQMATCFEAAPRLRYEELKTAIAARLDPDPAPEQIQAAFTALERLGFFWRPPGQRPPLRYEPGIPSLMSYVLDHPAPLRADE